MDIFKRNEILFDLHFKFIKMKRLGVVFKPDKDIISFSVDAHSFDTALINVQLHAVGIIDGYKGDKIMTKLREYLTYKYPVLHSDILITYNG